MNFQCWTVRVAMVAATTLGWPAAGAGQADALSPDVRSPDAIIKAVYDGISGAAGVKRDWDRWRGLFVPGARLIPSFRRPDGSRAHQVLTVDEYVTRAASALEANGFFEREIGFTEQRYGGILQRFSTYESRRAADDPEPFARGINSFQLLFDGERWWVVTVFWQGETPDEPIPEHFLRRP